MRCGEIGRVPAGSRIAFETASGELTAEPDGDRIAIELPARPMVVCDTPDGLVEALGAAPRVVSESVPARAHGNLVVEFSHESEVRALAPRFDRLRAFDFGVIATARGTGRYDFISRYFAAPVWHRRGPGDRIGALLAGAVLGGAAWQDVLPRVAGLRPRRRAARAACRATACACRATQSRCCAGSSRLDDVHLSITEDTKTRRRTGVFLWLSVTPRTSEEPNPNVSVRLSVFVSL